jgi:hypothetical protein
VKDFQRRSRIFLLGAAGEQEENGLGASASGPRGTLTQNVPLGSRVVSQKVNFLGQGNKGGSSRLPLGEERANILLLACCYQEGSNPGLLHFAHYNFCRRHQTLRMTPAMAAGITDHTWSMRELLEAA